MQCIRVPSPQLTRNSLVLRFVKDQFDDYRESTIGGMCPVQTCVLLMTDSLPPTAAFLTQTVTLEDQTSVKFEIWSVAEIFTVQTHSNMT